MNWPEKSPGQRVRPTISNTGTFTLYITVSKYLIIIVIFRISKFPVIGVIVNLVCILHFNKHNIVLKKFRAYSSINDHI